MRGLRICIDGNTYTVDIPRHKLYSTCTTTDKYYIYREPTNNIYNYKASSIVGIDLYGDIIILERQYDNCIIL